MSIVPLSTPFAVGEWQADPKTTTLRREAEIVGLEPKVMDLLALLAAAPGQVFSRAELDEILWPGVTVGEDTLSRAISKLRRALGDQPSDPHYIETIPKRGYRLIAAVSEIEGRPTARIALLKTHRTMIGGILAALLVFGVVTTLALTRPNAAEEVAAPPPSLAHEATERGHDLYMKFTRADNEAAIVLFERAIAADPAYAPAYAGLANALVQRAVRWQTQPGDAPSALSLTEALSLGIMDNAQAMGMLARAEDLGQRAVRLAPHDADAHKALGFTYSAQGDFDQARAYYERAVALDQDSWEAMVNLGELASFTDDPIVEREWFERAYVAMDRLYQDEPQRIGPWRAPIGILIGELYTEAGDDGSAEAWYRRVLDQTPLEPEATLRLVAILQRRGDDRQAQQLCQSLTAIIPMENCRQP